MLIALIQHRDCSCGPDAHAEDERNLAGILDWLWAAIAAPVLKWLGFDEPPNPHMWPRIWWCPSGELSFFPLHAAGRHGTRTSPVPQTVLDRVVSSYTPSVRALLHARRPGPGETGTQSDRVAVVAMPETPGVSSLPEARLLAGLFGDRANILTGPAATRDRLAAVLRTASWAHFACHADTDLADPTASRLCLYDHDTRPLTVLDLARLNLDHAELAFLSAGETAHAGPELADEAIHLGAACQVAGYRHVIATLWAVGDRPALRYAAEIYQQLAGCGPDGAALAVHHAVRRRRDLMPGRPRAWAAHLHYGG